MRFILGVHKTIFCGISLPGNAMNLLQQDDLSCNCNKIALTPCLDLASQNSQGVSCIGAIPMQAILVVLSLLLQGEHQDHLGHEETDGKHACTLRSSRTK